MISTILICAGLICIVAAAVTSIIRDKKKGKGCGCNCSSCAMSEKCHTKK